MSLDKMKLLIFLLFSLWFMSTYAFNVGDLTTEIQEDQSFVTKELSNQDKIAKFITAKVVEIDNPKSLKPVVGRSSEILISPAALFIGPERSANVKIYYQGPSDARERYYQLIFSEQSMNKSSQLMDGAGIEARQKISIATILVVRPRQIAFNYQVNGKGGITNTGNTFIQVVAVGQCVVAGENEAIACSKEDFILPGQMADFSNKFKIFEGYGLWLGIKYKFIPREDKIKSTVLQ